MELFFCGSGASIPPSGSVIEILLSSAVCVTQKWDVSLPQQSVSVTAATPGWDSGHFLSLSRSRSPPSLSTHLSFGTQMEPSQVKRALAV